MGLHSLRRTLELVVERIETLVTEHPQGTQEGPVEKRLSIGSVMAVNEGMSETGEKGQAVEGRGAGVGRKGLWKGASQRARDRGGSVRGMRMMAGHWADGALYNILHLMARIRGACSERSDTYHVQGVDFCLLRLAAWLCISSLGEAEISAIQQGLSYYLDQVVALCPWSDLFIRNVLLHSQSTW